MTIRWVSRDIRWVSGPSGGYHGTIRWVLGPSGEYHGTSGGYRDHPVGIMGHQVGIGTIR